MRSTAIRNVVIGVAVAGAAACGVEHGERKPDSVGMVEMPATLDGDEAVAGAAVRLVVAPTGNEVRYRVREQLANLDLPNDAVGKTGAVSGGITLDSTGRIIPEGSRFVIEVAGLTSDRDRRDNYVRRRLLVTDTFPNVVLEPTSIRGLTYPLPTSGTRTYDLVGNLTLKGVTRPTTWRLTANFAGDTVTGAATTRFTFKDFSLTQPRVPIVLSVADTIALEYDFKLGVARQ